MTNLFYRINEREQISLNDIDQIFIDKHALHNLVIPRLMFPPNYALRCGDVEVYYESCGRRISLLQIIKDGCMFRFDAKDPVAESYTKIMLAEMARYIPNEENPLHNRGDYGFILFHTNKNSPIYANLGDGLKLHKQSNENETFYSTLDHTKSKAVHYALFNKHVVNDRLPFVHETQDAVERVEHSNLPKGHATDIAYMHFLNSDVPLSSSNEQYVGGNKMWNRMAHRAFDDGHHVYMWDNQESKLHHLDSKEKLVDGVNHYFTTDRKLKGVDRGHIIISKDEIKRS